MSARVQGAQEAQGAQEVLRTLEARAAERVVLLTGVLRPSSIAAAVAQELAGQGTRLVLGAHPRTRRLTQASVNQASWAAQVIDVVDLDLTDPRHLEALVPALRDRGVVRLDGVLHAVAHADGELLGDSLLPSAGAHAGSWAHDVAEAFTVSVASLPALVGACLPLLGQGGDVVALTFESTRVMPGYGWMGPLKAALEATVRSLAVECGQRGVRVNAVSAGPLSTAAASAIPGFSELALRWAQRAPLGWEPRDARSVAATVAALLSGSMPATTGQVLRADGGAGLAW